MTSAYESDAEAGTCQASIAQTRVIEIMSSNKQHKRKLAAALRIMGTSLATHTHSTFKPSSAASKTLEEFKARRAAEKLGLMPRAKPKVTERFEIDVDTAQVTKLPLRSKTLKSG